MINIIFWAIFVSICTITSIILSRNIRRRMKIKENIIKVKAAIMVKIDNGDEFANLFDPHRLYDEPCLIPRYHFLGVRHIDIGEDLDKFWEEYNENEIQLKKHPRYKIYKLFLDNIGSTLDGGVDDTLNEVNLIIKKHTPVDGSYFVNRGGGGGGCSYIPCDMTKLGQLKCPGFEKMRKVWHNVIDSYDQFFFIIKLDEVDEFCEMCQLISGEDLIC